MSSPWQCVRCHGHEFAAATLQGAGLEITTATGATCGVDARVCLTCGAVMLTAREPGRLRPPTAGGESVQEYDF